MKKVLVSILCMLGIVGCTNKVDIQDEGIIEDTYSHSSVIVMVEEDTPQEEIDTLCEDLNLSVIYAYDIISGYALGTEREYTEEELDTLITNIEEYDFVMSVEKDQIMELDGE